jgi:hypothetical protein
MKWAIIFPNNWLSYSPSCLNFVKMLEVNGHDYLIIHVDDLAIDNSKLNVKHFPLIVSGLLPRILRRCKIYTIYLLWVLYFNVKKCHKKEYFDRFVGIDDVGYLAAYLLDKNAIYYSLEISRSIYNRFVFSLLDVSLLIIQSEERKKYLCKKDINTIYIQNSIISSPNKAVHKTYNERLIYFGNIIESHGVEFCINSLYSLKDEVLMIKGLKVKNLQYITYLQKKYSDLVDSKKLFFDFSYIEQDDIIDYLQQYSIGFCFYDFNLVSDFNYLSSPSGKMFNYFAAGLPIIGSDSIGLAPIKKFNAGILLKNPEAEEIVNAVKIISENYLNFHKNAINASNEYNYLNMFERNKKIKSPPPPPREIFYLNITIFQASQNCYFLSKGWLLI